jgi:hypothetical protein
MRRVLLITMCDHQDAILQNTLPNPSFRHTHLHTESCSQVPLTSLYSKPPDDAFVV